MTVTDGTVVRAPVIHHIISALKRTPFLPVAPGRDLVNVVETVAQEYKLRLAGQVAYRDLDAQIKRINANMLSS